MYKYILLKFLSFEKTYPKRNIKFNDSAKQ